MYTSVPADHSVIDFSANREFINQQTTYLHVAFASVEDSYISKDVAFLRKLLTVGY